MSAVPVDDRGFTLGHGLFETVLWEDGELRRWPAHLARLTRSCPALDLPAPDPETCRAEAIAAAQALAAPRAAVRLSWTAGSAGRGLDAPDLLVPRLVATAAPAPRPAGAARLATARVRRNDGSPASRLKNLSYLDNVLARAEARAAGADEALMLNTQGEVACAAAANLFWIREGRVFTPSLECGVLAGVVRAEVLAACAALQVSVQEVRAGPEALQGAAVFFTNSLIGVRLVSSLDGHGTPDDPLIERLRTAIEA